MRSFIKHTVCSIAFVAGLVVLLLAISQIMVPKNNAKDDGMQDSSANGILSEPENTIDVLILGDSESHYSIIPLRIWEQHGITSYNCGTSAQTLYYSQEFLYKAFENQTPKVVILETDAIFREFSFGDMLLNKASMVFPVFAYHNRWKSLKAHDWNLSINHTYIDSAKGYKFTANVAAANADAEDYMKETDECAPISVQNRACVKSIAAYCEEKGAKLVLVSTPSIINWNTPRHNSIQKLSEELGIDYIDMNLLKKQIPIDWKNDTHDKGDHVNYFGAEKVTAYLGKYLFDTGLLNSHKDKQNYKHWDEALENFNQTISTSLPKQ